MKLEKSAILPVIVAALKEDVGPRDLTTWALIPRNRFAKADLVVREEGIVAGLPVAEWTFGQVDPRIRFKPNVADGDKVYPDKVVAFLEGPAQGILTAERVALNFLSRMSGVATLTRRFVERVGNRSVAIMDTRKTTPTLRLLEKYAVQVGGGVPHRMGLFDQVLIKENHLRLVASSPPPLLPPPLRGRGEGASGRLSPIERAVMETRVKVKAKGIIPKGVTPTIEVEVTNLKRFRQALSARADAILLDNMRLSQIQEAVRIRNAILRSRKGYSPILEVSGGVTLETVQAIAASGVDRISVGAMTHSAPALNVALELVG